MIAHPNPASAPTTKKLGFNLVQVPDQNLAAIAQQTLKRQQGIALRPLDGTQKYIAYLPLKEANWSVVLVIPRENIEAQLRSLDVIALVVAGLAVTMLAVLWQVQTLEQKTPEKSQRASGIPRCHS